MVIFMTIDLRGKHVLVTGASRGIGKSTAMHLAASGASVALHYNHNQEIAETLASQLGNNCQCFQADLSKEKEVLDMFSSILKVYGHLDVVVNNAGTSVCSPAENSTDEWLLNWSKTLAVNLSAAALICKLALDHFLERDGGKIINISSRAAFRGDTSDYLAYAASKGGLVALTRSIARSYGKKGIVAFDIAPGFTRIDMADQFLAEYGEDYAVSDIALTRLTTPDDIAPMIVFLASGLADHATGTTIDINAGSYVH